VLFTDQWCVDVCYIGLLLRMFMNLYNSEVIDEDAFMQWKEELNDVHPGKGQALFQVAVQFYDSFGLS